MKFPEINAVPIIRARREQGIEVSNLKISTELQSKAQDLLRIKFNRLESEMQELLPDMENTIQQMVSFVKLEESYDKENCFKIIVPGVEEDSEPVQKKRKTEVEVPKGKEGKMEENVKVSNENMEDDDELDRVKFYDHLLMIDNEQIWTWRK